MKLLSGFKKRFPLIGPVRRRPSGPLLIAFWDREKISYLIAAASTKRTAVVDTGSVLHSDQPTPLMALAEHLRKREIQIQHLIVLLSRPEVDVLILDLPPADVSELPSLVAGEVDRQLGESETPPCVDFHSVSEADGEGVRQGQHVLAFAMSAVSMESLRNDAAQAGFRLSAVSFRQLCALSQLRRGPNQSATLSVAVQVYQGEVELAFCIGNRPLLLRSVRVNLEDIGRVAEQLLVETDRCVTMLPPELEELPRHWFIDASSQAAKQLAAALESLGQGQVHAVEPVAAQDVPRLHQSSEKIVKVDAAGETAGSSANLEMLSSELPCAALTGAVWDFTNERLAINLADPKRSPPPPNPLVRPIAWSSVAGIAVAVVATALMSDVWQLRDRVQELELQLTDAKKMESKLQEKSDQVAVVEDWLADQVNWLEVLNDISQRLPDGKNATIRRLSASAAEETGVVDLSVQVSQPQDISELESRLRSVKYEVTSKRISQSPEAAEYPWQFETRISFSAERTNWNQYGAAKTETVPDQSTKPQLQPENPPESITQPDSLEPDRTVTSGAAP